MGYLKGLTRFNYWEYPAINPLLCHAGESLEASAAFHSHRYLSAQYSQAHSEGDAQAIFKYVQADVWAFRAPWVVKQIEVWRQENSPKSRDKLHRLMRSYASEGRGKRHLLTTYNTIKREQEIFKAVIKLNKLTSPKTPLQGSRDDVGCFKIVAKSHHSTEDDVKRIYQRYKRKVDQCMGKLTSQARSIIQLAKEKGMIPPDQEPIPLACLLSSWDEVFQWLDTMAKALKAAAERGEEE